MTKKDATKMARQMFGKEAFVYTNGSPLHYVCDGTKDADGYYIAVGIGLSWEEAVKDANRHRRTRKKSVTKASKQRFIDRIRDK